MLYSCFTFSLPASQKVALSVQELVSSANLIATTESGDEEAVIAAARGVASSTAHLVAASRAKGDPHSPAQIAISNHAKQVAQFAAKLTAHANERGLAEEKKEDASSPKPVTNSIFFEMEQNIKIQNLEKQLEQELQRQRRMRQDKYKGAK
jgi:talin